MTAGVAVLHAGPRATEVALARSLVTRGIDCAMYDVAAPDSVLRELLSSPDAPLLVNRVYPSDVFVSPKSVVSAEHIVTVAYEKGIPLFNSVQATRADYSKLYNATVLLEAGISTPATFPLASVDEHTPPFLPLVVKRDTGGYGRDADIVRTEQQWRDMCRSPSMTREDFIVQQFIPSTQPHDWRITVVDGIVVGSYTRSLVDDWIGSVERGSRVEAIARPPQDVTDLARCATSAIGAAVNGADIVVSSWGAVLIESNVTPGFDPAVWAAIGVDPIEEVSSAIAARAAA